MMISQARMAILATRASGVAAAAARSLGCLQAVFWTRRSQQQQQQPLRRHLRSAAFTPSNEQQTVAGLCAEHNVLVSARPGSGKTATVQAIVAAHPDKHTCAILYSKQLQRETAQRLGAYANVEVMTFHGMGGRLTGKVMPTDLELLRHRERISSGLAEPFRWRHAPFDIVILDEFQDCSERLFWLVCQFIAANNRVLRQQGRSPARLVVLGDEPQCIFQFMGADQRYLTLAPTLLGALAPYAFSTVPLSRSFRLSRQTVDFINTAFLGGEQRIVSTKEGPKPQVLRCRVKTESGRDALTHRLARMIQQYGPENAAIIAPSGRGKYSPLQRLINALAKDYGVPICTAFEDAVPLDDKVTQGKLCATTFHQFKGRERNLVIVFGADASYFTVFGKTLPHDRCPNAVYVALTRAAQQLVLVHDEDGGGGVMPFVQVDALYKTADVINTTPDITMPLLQPPPPSPRPSSDGKLDLPTKDGVGVTDLLRHMPLEVLDSVITRELVIDQLEAPLPRDQHLFLHSIVPAGPKEGMHEATSDINGMVVAAAHEHQIAGTLKSIGWDQPPFLFFLTPVGTRRYCARLSQQACKYEAKLSGYKPRSIQMQGHRFDWIRPQHLAKAVSRTRTVVGNHTANLQFEKPLAGRMSLDGQEVLIMGMADIVSMSETPSGSSDDAHQKNIDVIWEIKFVTELSLTHIAQVCIYAYLASLMAASSSSSSGKVPRMVLFNARDNETLQITPRDGAAGLKRMIEALLRAKYTSLPEQDTDALIQQCATITSEVLGVVDPAASRIENVIT